MSLRVHHLNCGTLCPVCQRLINGHGSWLRPATLVCHCLLIETPQALVLVDTGLGQADIAAPQQRLGFAGKLLRPRLDPAETALARVRALGHDPRDVRHIITTHLDLDHAGGLADFPAADVHLLAAELDAALKPSRHDRARYRQPQFSHAPRWRPHAEPGEDWFGFAATPPVAGLDNELLLVSLPGHSSGHCGVAVRTAEGWLLHAGDAYFHRATLAGEPVPPGIALIERVDEVDGARRRHTQQRLRALPGEGVRVFCSHDPQEWQALAGASSAKAVA